jgi:hypothetical protein
MKSRSNDPEVQPFVKKPKKSSAITNLSVFLPAWNPFYGMVFENQHPEKRSF